MKIYQEVQKLLVGNTQTDTQADTQIGRQAGRQTDRQTNWLFDKPTFIFGK
jgi:hypothetical protein